MGETAEGSGRLAAFFVTKGETPPTTESVREYLGQRLPDYMVPPALTALDDLPLTANGKVDKKQLAKQVTVLLEKNRPKRIAPRNEIEKQVAGIWCELLGCKEVGVLDNFFEIGGNSLLALRMHTRLQAISPRDISIVNIFEHTTVNALSRFMTAEHNIQATTSTTTDRGIMRRERMKRKMRRHQ